MTQAENHERLLNSIITSGGGDAAFIHAVDQAVRLADAVRYAHPDRTLWFSDGSKLMIDFVACHARAIEPDPATADPRPLTGKLNDQAEREPLSDEQIDALLREISTIAANYVGYDEYGLPLGVNTKGVVIDPHVKMRAAVRAAFAAQQPSATPTATERPE